MHVSIDEFRSGTLPHCCVGTGRPQAPLRRVTASYRPLWPYLLIPFGNPSVTWFLADEVAIDNERQVSGWIPLSDEAMAATAALRRRARRVSIGALVGTPVVVLACAAAGWAIVAVTALVLGVVTAFVGDLQSLLPRGTTRLTLSRDGESVILQNVHPAFEAAVNRDRHRRRPAGGSGGHAASRREAADQV